MKRKTLRLKELEHNRYSILTNDLTRCYICPRPKSDLHEIYEGCHRQNSMRYGLVLPLCKECHLKIHRSLNFALPYKQLGQSKFEETHSRDEFIKLFGRNYLD